MKQGGNNPWIFNCCLSFKVKAKSYGEKKKIIWGEKDKKKAFIYTKKIQQVYGIKNQKIWHYVKPGHLAVSRSGNLLLP